MRTLILVAAITACAGTDPDTAGTTWEAPDGGVITLQTRDEVALEADYLPAATEGAPSVLLVHMIPPSNTRADWPESFRQRLAAQGWTVMAVDRRGAGGSEGVAVEAYEGEKGKWDVEACARRMADDGYGPIVVVGASNGTTSMVDYAAWAGSEGLPVPVGLAYLSGGSYTENQTPLTSVPSVPAAFLYPPEESAWPESKRDLDPGTWSFTAYTGGAHGTRLFTTSADEQVQTDLVAFIDGIVGD